MISKTLVSGTVLAALALVTGLITSAQADMHPQHWNYESAIPASALANSIGINVHLSYDSYLAHADLLRAKLLDSGIRHIRTGIFLADPASDLARIESLAAVGIRSDLIVDIHTNDDTLQGYLRGAPGIELVEGPNEYNNSGDPQWAPHLRSFQQHLYAQAHAHGIPVIGPSVTNVEAFQQLGDLQAFMDYGNMHNYFAGYNPGTVGWGGGFEGALYGSLAYNVHAAQITSGNHRIMSTETGYCTLPTTKNAVAPDIAARYIPRLYLEQWLQHIPRTYLYEFIDEGSSGCDSHLGLLTHELEEKPGYIALRSLTHDLIDRPATFAPQRLGYALSGISPSVHHLLIEKHPGNLQLMVWNETPSWDTNDGTGQPLVVAPQSAVLSVAPGWKIGSIRNFTDEGTLERQQAETVGRSSRFLITDRLTVVNVQKVLARPERLH